MMISELFIFILKQVIICSGLNIFNSRRKGAELLCAAAGGGGGGASLVYDSFGVNNRLGGVFVYSCVDFRHALVSWWSVFYFCDGFVAQHSFNDNESMKFGLSSPIPLFNGFAAARKSSIHEDWGRWSSELQFNWCKLKQSIFCSCRSICYHHFIARLAPWLQLSFNSKTCQQFLSLLIYAAAWRSGV